MFASAQRSFRNVDWTVSDSEKNEIGAANDQTSLWCRNMNGGIDVQRRLKVHCIGPKGIHTPPFDLLRDLTFASLWYMTKIA